MAAVACTKGVGLRGSTAGDNAWLMSAGVEGLTCAGSVRAAIRCRPTESDPVTADGVAVSSL